MTGIQPRDCAECGDELQPTDTAARVNCIGICCADCAETYSHRHIFDGPAELRWVVL